MLRSSVPSSKPLFLQFGVIARSLLGSRFLNRSSFDLLRRDGPCRLPVCLVHWTHLLFWDRMTFYLRKAAERSSALPLMLRSSYNFFALLSSDRVGSGFLRFFRFPAFWLYYRPGCAPPSIRKLSEVSNPKLYKLTKNHSKFLIFPFFCTMFSKEHRDGKQIVLLTICQFIRSAAE